jgi:hypothetical protein
MATPDFGIYGSSASDWSVPGLTPAGGQYATPYYSARTNDGDFAGAVMADAGQKIRLVDAKTGQVVYEGVGPEAAQQATGIANAVSQDKGRKAAWRIEADYGDQGWKTQAAERYDPKKQSGWGTLLDIAAPFILNAILPGVGGALAAGLGSIGGAAATAGLANLGSGLIQGEGLGEAAKGALLAGGTSGLLTGVGNAIPAVGNTIGKVTNPVQDAFNTALGPVRAIADPINQGFVNLIDGAGNVVSTIRGGVDEVRGALAGASASGGVTGPGDLNIQLPTGGYAGQIVDVAPVDVIGSNLNVLPGVPSSLFGGGVTDVEGVDVVAKPRDDTPLPTPGGDLAVTPPGTTPPPATGGPGPLPGVPTPPSDNGGGNGWTIPTGVGTRDSLSSIFSAQLPEPTFGTRTPRDVVVDTRYAIDNPEASFFVEVPQRQGFAEGGEVDDDDDDVEEEDVEEIEVEEDDSDDDEEELRKVGYAVFGKGGGRDDMIDAHLSDGEYVIDAETVALLGNGSTKAGADALDQFRVNVRKHKGRDLAKGRFSANARKAHDYLEKR